jgi:hypothetical protein
VDPDPELEVMDPEWNFILSKILTLILTAMEFKKPHFEKRK